MRLAEALAQRKDKSNVLGRDFAERALDRLTYEEGVEDRPSEDQAQGVLEEIAETTEEISRLSVLINETNNAVSIEWDGGTLLLMEAISKRDALAREISTLNTVIQAVENATNSGSRRRYGGYRSKDDIEVKPVISLANLRHHLDSRSGVLRRLDIEIQKVNWAEDLDI